MRRAEMVSYHTKWRGENLCWWECGSGILFGTSKKTLQTMFVAAPLQSSNLVSLHLIHNKTDRRSFLGFYNQFKDAIRGAERFVKYIKKNT